LLVPAHAQTPLRLFGNLDNVARLRRARVLRLIDAAALAREGSGYVGAYARRGTSGGRTAPSSRRLGPSSRSVGNRQPARGGTDLRSLVYGLTHHTAVA
jgi:hypothetical protein